MKNLQVFCHVGMMNSWKTSVDIITDSIKNSRLINVVEKINYCVNGDLSSFNRHVTTLSKNEFVIPLEEHVDYWEFPTINYLKTEGSMYDQYILYIHTKGSSRPDNLPSRENDSLFLKRALYNVINNYETCINALENGYDCAGFAFRTNPFVHYTGNFWWTTSNHVKKLTYLTHETRNFNFNIDFPHRHDAEKWVCSIPGKFYNVEN